MSENYGELVNRYLDEGNIKNAREMINRLAEKNQLKDLWQVVSYMNEDTKTDKIAKNWGKIEENVDGKKKKSLSDLLMETRDQVLEKMSANDLSKLMMSMQDQTEEDIFWDDLEKSLEKSSQNKKEMEYFLIDKIIGMNKEDIGFIEKNDQRYPSREDLEKLFGKDVSDKLFHYKSIENMQSSGSEITDNAINQYRENLKASLTHGKVDLIKFDPDKDLNLDLKDLDKIAGVLDKISFDDLCPQGLLEYRKQIYSRVNDKSYVDLYHSALENDGMDSILGIKKMLLLENLDERLRYMDRYSVKDASEKVNKEIETAKGIIGALKDQVENLQDKVVPNKLEEIDIDNVSQIIERANEFIQNSEQPNLQINILLAIDNYTQALFPKTQFAEMLRELIANILVKFFGSEIPQNKEPAKTSFDAPKEEFNRLVKTFDGTLDKIDNLNKSFLEKVMEIASESAGMPIERDQRFDGPRF